MGAIKGKDFMFFLSLDSGVTMLCHATDFSISTSTDAIETTGPNNGSWKSYIPGLNSYTLSVPGIVTYTDPLNFIQLKEIQHARQIVEWTAGLSADGGLQLTGSMYITSTVLTSQFRDAVKFDMTAQGTGPQNIVKSPTAKTVYLANTKGIRLPGCPNPYPVGVLWYDGTLIGLATSADDVVSLFNDYAATQGGYLTISLGLTGCDFNMLVAWNSPMNPTFIPAVTGEGFVIGGAMIGEVIGEDDSNQNIIGA